MLAREVSDQQLKMKKMTITPSSTTLPKLPKPRHLGRRAVLGVGLLGVMTLGTAALMYATIEPGEAFAADPEAAQRQALLAKVKSWSALTNLDDVIAATEGLVVVSADGITALKMSTAQKRIEAVQGIEAGARRLVFAHLSLAQVGQIDELLARGIDGVFLDARGAMQTAQAGGSASISRLSATIVRLAETARLVNPDFLVVLHNAAELTADPRVERVIDGAAHDNLLYGLDGIGVANGGTEIASALHDLNRVKRSGRPVFVVESLAHNALVARTGVRRKLTELGFIGRIAEPKSPS